MKKIKFSIYFLFLLNVVLLLFLLFIEFKYSDQFNKFDLLVSNDLNTLTKIKVLDSDYDLYSDNNSTKENLQHEKVSKRTHSGPLFILPEQSAFWNRWKYSLLSSMQDSHFYTALTQVKTVGVYNSGVFNNTWLNDVYYPFQLNSEGLLELEVLIIGWALSEDHYKVTLQYDFYHIKTNKRYYEHVVNIIFSR